MYGNKDSLFLLTLICRFKVYFCSIGSTYVKTVQPAKIITKAIAPADTAHEATAGTNG